MSDQPILSYEPEIEPSISRIVARDPSGLELGQLMLREETPEGASSARRVAYSTKVFDAGAGKGIGKLLFWELVRLLRARQERVLATCPFVISMLEKNPDTSDVLYLAEP